MAVKAAQGGGVVAGVRSLGGGVIALSWSIAWGPYGCSRAVGSLIERAGGDLGRAAMPVRMLLLAVLLSGENAKRLGI